MAGRQLDLHILFCSVLVCLKSLGVFLRFIGINIEYLIIYAVVLYTMNWSEVLHLTSTRGWSSWVMISVASLPKDFNQGTAWSSEDWHGKTWRHYYVTCRIYTICCIMSTCWSLVFCWQVNELVSGSYLAVCLLKYAFIFLFRLLAEHRKSMQSQWIAGEED